MTKIGSVVSALSRDEDLEIATAAGRGARRRHRLTWLDTDRSDQAAVMAAEVFRASITEQRIKP